MKKAGDILKEMLDSLGIAAAKTPSIFSEWEKIAGKDIALHSEISDIDKNCLYLETDHPGWIQIINLKKQQILGEIEKEFPGKGITEIKVLLRKRNSSVN